MAPVAPGSGTPTGDVTVTSTASLCTATSAARALSPRRRGSAHGDGDVRSATRASSPARRLRRRRRSIGQLDHDGHLVGQSLGLRAVGDLHGHGVAGCAVDGTPTGTVVFRSMWPALRIDPRGGVATLARSPLTAGPHTVSVAYGGDTASGQQRRRRRRRSTRPARRRRLDLAAESVGGRRAGDVLATVGTVAPGAGTPTGTVILTIDGVAGTPVALTGNVATFHVGVVDQPHTVTAAYSGDASYAVASSDTLTQTVKPATTTTVVRARSVDGWPVGDLHGHRGAGSAGEGTPTGSVDFDIDGAPSRPRWSAASRRTRRHRCGWASTAVSATYDGDATFAGSFSAPWYQTVNAGGAGCVRPDGQRARLGSATWRRCGQPSRAPTADART